MRGAGGLVTDVVVKVLLADLPPGAVRRLRDEARALARLSHPNIVRVVDLADLDGRAGLITEYVPGVDAAAVVAELSPRAAAEVAAAVAGALDAAATAGFVHRDVKPGNVRIGRHGEVKLLDFGLAWTDGERESKTASNVVVGSVPYLAPERFLDRRARPPADVFGLGALFFELLTAERFHHPATGTAVAARSADPDAWRTWLDARLASLPAPTRAAEPLLRRLLAWEPGDRPTAREAATALDALSAALPGPSTRTWARDRAWTEPQPGTGSLEGRTIEEREPDDVSTEPARPPAPEAPPPEAPTPEAPTLIRPGRRKATAAPGWPVAVVLTVGVVVVAGVVGLGALTVAAALLGSLFGG